MFGTRKPSEIAAQLKVEYSPHSPAMRLTLVNYALQYGIPQSFEGTPREFLDGLMEFVAADYETFTAELDEVFADNETDRPATIADLDVDFDPGSSPYL